MSDDYEPRVYCWARGNQKISQDGEQFVVWHGGDKCGTASSMIEARALADEARSRAEWNS